jgi:hypothetical protein
MSKVLLQEDGVMCYPDPFSGIKDMFSQLLELLPIGGSWLLAPMGTALVEESCALRILLYFQGSSLLRLIDPSLLYFPLPLSLEKSEG